MVQLQEKMFKLVLRLQGTIKLYHWNTPSYNRHLISDQLYSQLDPSLDKFIELLLAKQGRKQSVAPISISYQIMTDEQFHLYLKQFAQAFIILIDKVFDPKNDSDIINIKDEILVAINQALYLSKTRP